MLNNIAIILGVLVAFNFLLLKLSCNKITKKKDNKRPLVITKTKVISSQSSSTRLSPTGS